MFCDDFCMQLAQKVFYPHLFKRNPQDIVKHDIALANGLKRGQDENEEQKEEVLPSFGMLDFAYYFNDQKSADSEGELGGVNVAAHTDPGLFSIHFGSSCEGLQFFDMATDTWIPIDPRVGVLFCGQKAQEVSQHLGEQQSIKAARHRCVYPDAIQPHNKVRFSCWFEMCLNTQVSKQALDGSRNAVVKARIHSPEIKLTIKGKWTTRTLEGLSLQDTVKTVLRRLEIRTHVPMTKSGIVRERPTNGKLMKGTDQLKWLQHDSTLQECGIKDGDTLFWHD
jgi:hypothetical protein